MERWNGRIAVVTGASSGIGWATTRILLKAGMQVVGLALEFDEPTLRKQLPTTQRSAFVLRQCDISDAADVAANFEWIKQRYQRINVMVNNAGMAKISKLLDVDNEAKLKRVVDVNLMGTVYCTKQAYQLMKTAMDMDEECHIITVNSLLGHLVPIHVPQCGMNLYPVVKHALRATHEVLRRELQTHKLMRLSSISPGLTDTNFAASANEGVTVPAEENILQDVEMLKPEDVARGVEFILASPPHVVIAELMMVPHERY